MAKKGARRCHRFDTRLKRSRCQVPTHLVDLLFHVFKRSVHFLDLLLNHLTIYLYRNLNLLQDDLLVQAIDSTMLSLYTRSATVISQMRHPEWDAPKAAVDRKSASEPPDPETMKRLDANPFESITHVDETGDRRRERRALSSG